MKIIMKKNMDKLPKDIIMKIISYTYEFQSKTLLDDIKDYTNTKDEMLYLYYNFWEVIWGEADNEGNHWLINDIHAYANNYKASMYGYVDKFYNICKRNIFLKTNQDVDKYIIYLDKQEVKTQINVFLALLTATERNEIILYALEYMK